MKTRPGRPRGLTRLARALGLHRNPLRRATDRAEAWLRVGLLGIFLIAGPMAALEAAHRTYHPGITVARVSAAPAYPVTPAAPAHPVRPAALRQAPTITDLHRAGHGGRAGARGEGTHASARTGGAVAAVMTLAAMALALLAVLRLALAFLNRRRLAAWETAWSKVGPQWSKRSP
jgi:hypothetical protein